MLKRLVIATAAFAASVLPALAGENGIECRCLYQGKYFDQGDTVCIRVDGRSRMVRCDMMLNNSSWTFLPSKNGCPTALMSPLPPYRATSDSASAGARSISLL